VEIPLLPCSTAPIVAGWRVFCICLMTVTHDLILYNCCWPSPAQSFSDPSPARLTTMFYCLRFETPPTWKTRSPYLYPPGAGWPSYTTRHWIPFPSPLATRRATVELFEPAFTRVRTDFLYNADTDHIQNTTSSSSSVVAFVYILMRSRESGVVETFTEPLSSNGHLLRFCYSGFQQTCHNTLSEAQDVDFYYILLC
jgi:hypothetical protein